MVTDSRPAQAYIDALAKSRGAVPEYHKVMARHDFDVLSSMNGLARATLEARRSLDSQTKQLIFLVALVAQRAAPGFLHAHIERALDLGVEPLAVLEAIELVLPVAGTSSFLPALEAWGEVTKAATIEQSDAA